MSEGWLVGVSAAVGALILAFVMKARRKPAALKLIKQDVREYQEMLGKLRTEDTRSTQEYKERRDAFKKNLENYRKRFHNNNPKPPGNGPDNAG